MEAFYKHLLNEGINERFGMTKCFFLPLGTHTLQSRVTGIEGTQHEPPS